MQLAKRLIDAAVKVCKSKAELSRRIGVYPADITHLYSGERPLSPELAALIADVGHIDARQAALDAVIERNEGKPIQRQMVEILGKDRAGGGAETLHISYNDSSTQGLGKTRIDRDSDGQLDNVIIVSKLRDALLWSKQQLQKARFPDIGSRFNRYAH